MEQLILILVIALIGFINWVFKKSVELREKRKQERQVFEGGEILREEPESAPVSEDPDDSMRKLMEALGLPMDAAPPLPPRPAQALHPVPKPPQIVPSLPPSQPKAVPAPYKSAFRHVEPLVKPPPSRLHELLASQTGLRDAVVLSEILGPPKSQR